MILLATIYTEAGKPAEVRANLAHLDLAIRIGEATIHLCCDRAGYTFLPKDELSRERARAIEFLTQLENAARKLRNHIEKESER